MNTNMNHRYMHAILYNETKVIENMPKEILQTFSRNASAQLAACIYGIESVLLVNDIISIDDVRRILLYCGHKKLLRKMRLTTFGNGPITYSLNTQVNYLHYKNYHYLIDTLVLKYPYPTVPEDKAVVMEFKLVKGFMLYA